MNPTAAAVAVSLAASAPTLEQLKATAREEIERFEGKAEKALGAKLFTSGYQLHFAGNPAMDLAGHQQVLDGFRAAFPDLSITVLAQVAQGDRVANHFVMKGTQRGDFQGVTATGKAVAVTGTNLMRFEGGKIAELHGQLDLVGLMQQLGAVPAPPAGQPAPALAIAAPTKGSALPVVRRFIDAFNAHDVAALGRECASSYALDFPGGPTGTGVEGIRAAATEFIAAFPDLLFSVDELLEDGGRVAWRWTMTGTHRGQLGPIAATERPVRLTGLSVLTVREGKIVQDKVRADMLGLMGQLGALKR